MWEEKGFDLEVDWEADLEPGSSAGSGAALELVAQHLLCWLVGAAFLDQMMKLIPGYSAKQTHQIKMQSRNTNKTIECGRFTRNIFLHSVPLRSAPARWI